MKLPSKVQSKVFGAIFGPSGLIHAKCDEEFEAEKLLFDEKYGKFMDPAFKEDFLNRIFYNVCNPAWVSDRVDVFYTNNDSECYNRWENYVILVLFLTARELASLVVIKGQF